VSDLQALSSQNPGPVITETSPGEANTATLMPGESEKRRSPRTACAISGPDRRLPSHSGPRSASSWHLSPAAERATEHAACLGARRPHSFDRCYDLAVHHDQVTGVVVLEYASQGRVVATGAAYSNRYISVLSIVDRKVAHWRDYLDPLAVFDAVGWPAAAADSD